MVDTDWLESVRVVAGCSVYRVGAADALVRRCVVSTPETRRICNDPLVVGVEYTTLLREACRKALCAFAECGWFAAAERETVVLHVLRGGLNFGLREALAAALGWNGHGSAFISAQRARDSRTPEDWYITESDYRKVYLPATATVVLGDVVATGTSLLHALRELLNSVEAPDGQIRQIVFFTIGGVRAEEIVAEIDAACRERFPAYHGALVVYLEGRFGVATPESRVSVKITGTDLLRSPALLAPEFAESQYEAASYPLERCTIYDAGSRAFWLPEYLADLREYWQALAALAAQGMTFAELLQERFPELDAARFGSPALGAVCERQLARISSSGCDQSMHHEEHEEREV